MIKEADFISERLAESDCVENLNSLRPSDAYMRQLT